MGVIEWKAELFSNPKKGKRAFDALVQMLQTQQSRLETLADECKRLEERVNVQSLQDQIDQMSRKMKSSEMANFVEAARTNLVSGLKKKQDFVYKLKLEHLEDELADLKEWFDILSHRCPTEKDVCPELLHDIIEERGGENGSSMTASTKKGDRRALEIEVKRLKCEYEKLSIKNSSEVSALLSEKEFVWNQFREMESRYTTQLQVKNDEVKLANTRVTKLLETLEHLQSSSKEKDAQIADLKASLTKMEAEAGKKDGEISRMLEELESLKKSRSDSLTPVLKRCTAEPKAKALNSDNKHGSKKTPVLRRHTAEPKDKPLSSDAKHGSRKTTRIMKRKSSSSQDNKSEKRKKVAFMEEAPKLFTSNFKIPKLKSSSPH